MANTKREVRRWKREPMPPPPERAPSRRESLPDPSRVVEPVRPNRREKVGV